MTGDPIPSFKVTLPEPPTTDKEIAESKARERDHIAHALKDPSHPLYEGLAFMRRAEILDEALEAEPRCREQGIPYLVPKGVDGYGIGGYYAAISPEHCAVCGKPVGEHSNPPPPPPLPPLNETEKARQWAREQRLEWERFMEQKKAASTVVNEEAT